MDLDIPGGRGGYGDASGGGDGRAVWSDHGGAVLRSGIGMAGGPTLGEQLEVW
jgi:hypothetical protein